MLEKKISERITVFGFFMACLIVAVHSTSKFSEFEWVLVNGFDARMNDIVENFFGKGSDVGLRFFFTTTGFLLFRNLTFSNCGEKIRRRVFSLLIPYVIWEALAVAHNAIYMGMRSWEELLRRAFLFDSPINGPIWYIYTVFLLSLFSPLLLLLFKNRKLGFFGVLAISLGLFSWKSNPLSGYGCVGGIQYFLPAYLFGAFFGYFYRSEDRDSTIKYFFYMLLGALLWNAVEDGSFTYFAGTLLPILILLYLPIPAWLAKLPIYRFSFIMYVSHIIFVPHLLATVYRIMNRIMPYGFLANLFGRLACVFFCFAGAAVIYLVLAKVAPGVLSVLTGGRSRSDGLCQKKKKG